MQAFAVFAFCWALSGLLDIAPFAAWFRSPTDTLFAASCLLVLLRPGSLWAFGAMNALRVAASLADSPENANHQVLFAVASATILATWLQVAWREGSPRRVTPARWRSAFAPLLRAELLILYFFAVFHKLNHDYLDPVVSCAVNTLLAVVPAWVGDAIGSEPGPRHALIYGSLAAEVLIPVLLVIRPTRRVGVVAGVLFHSLLGIRFFAFSTGLLALYSLFVPGAVFQGAAAAAKRLREARDPRGWLYALWTARVAAVGLVVGFGWVASLLRDPDAGIALPRAGFPALATLWVLGVLAVLAGLLLAREARPHWRERAPGRLISAGVLLVLPLLVFLNGVSPYLGLRTVPAFSMFSNLRTEGGITNHLFMPATALRVASYQEDLVTILAVEDDGLRRFARRPRRTFFDLQRIVQKMALEQGKTDIAISFRRGGRRVDLRNAERDPDLMARNPWLQRKLLRFRAVPISRRRECSW